MQGVTAEEGGGVDADVAGFGHGLGDARFGRGAGQAGADAVAGRGAGFDEAAVFEDRIGWEDGGEADVALQGHAADGEEPVAGAQGGLVDEVLEGARELDVERRGRGGGERLDHGDGERERPGAEGKAARRSRRSGAGLRPAQVEQGWECDHDNLGAGPRGCAGGAN